MKKHLTLVLLLLLSIDLIGQNKLLQSGPMVGYSGMREVLLWAQTTEAATVKFEYWEKETKGNSFFTEEATTSKDMAFVAKLIADQVLPNKEYEYALYINDKKIGLHYPAEFQTQKLWRGRSQAPNFKFALASCFYVNEPEFDRPGEAFGGDFGILVEVIKSDPDFMVWLGDNTYLREADLDTRTGIQHRYTHTRSYEGLQPLLANVHHYAIWDDHDFGPNDGAGNYFHKDKTLETFKNFWGNPGYGINGKKGITSMFSWGDCDFFLLDNRYFRSSNYRKTGERTQIGQEQFDWLITSLKESDASFKFVCIGGQVLNSAERYETYSHFFPEERKALLAAIKDENIKGVVFLDGDRHHTELSKVRTDTDLTIYDLTVSPLTAGAHDAKSEVNVYRVRNTQVGERNFAVCEVSGNRGQRILTITVYNAEGEEMWQKEIEGE